MASLSGRALAPYLVLFAALYAGFGVQSPYLPALLGEAYHRFWIAPVTMAPKGGESFLDLLERVHGAIRRLDAQFAGRDIIAVTHGGTIRAALALALELTPETALAFTIENCSLTRIVRHNDAGNGHPWGVVSVNQSPV